MSGGGSKSEDNVASDRQDQRPVLGGEGGHYSAQIITVITLLSNKISPKDAIIVSIYRYQVRILLQQSGWMGWTIQTGHM